MADPITDAAEALWVSGPLRVHRRFRSTRGVLGDWHGLALAPPLALLSLILVTVGYFVVGALGLGFVDVYSESLALMAILIAVGAFSGQLGLAGLVGFALGDFLIGHRTWSVARFDENVVEGLIRARLPLIIGYLLLAVAVLVIPRLGKNLALGIGQWRRIPAEAAWLIATPVTVVVSWLGLRTWAAMAPTLIRPFFVWSGGAPTVEAIQVFQRQTSDLVAAGVAATVVRQAVIGLFIYLPPLARSLARLEARAHLRVAGGGPIEAPPPPSPAARFGADVFGALLASLVLAGIIETRSLWLIVFGCFLAVRLLRSGTVSAPPLERWKAMADRVPVVARLGFTWLLAVAYRSLLTDERIGSYRTMAILVLVGVVVAFLLFPGSPRPAESTPAGGPEPRPDDGPPAAAPTGATAGGER